MPQLRILLSLLDVSYFPFQSTFYLGGGGVIFLIIYFSIFNIRGVSSNLMFASKGTIFRSFQDFPPKEVWLVCNMVSSWLEREIKKLETYRGFVQVRVLK